MSLDEVSVKQGQLNVHPSSDVYTLIATLSRVFFSRYPDVNPELRDKKLSADFYHLKQKDKKGQSPDRPKKQDKAYYLTFSESLSTLESYENLRS